VILRPFRFITYRPFIIPRYPQWTKLAGRRTSENTQASGPQVERIKGIRTRRRFALPECFCSSLQITRGRWTRRIGKCTGRQTNQLERQISDDWATRFGQLQGDRSWNNWTTTAEVWTINHRVLEQTCTTLEWRPVNSTRQTDSTRQHWTTLIYLFIYCLPEIINVTITYISKHKAGQWD